MNNELLIGLINNAALVLALGLLYEVFMLRREERRGLQRQVGAGVVLGSITIAVMINAFPIETDIIFDTRSIVLAISGLFFGIIPTLIAGAMAIIYRVYLVGGGGALTGVLVITTSAGMGLAWRHLRARSHLSATLTELYLFGVAVHILMLVCMLALPAANRIEIIAQIAWPVMLVYPAATAILGRLMVHRYALHQAERDLEQNNILLRTVIDNIPGMVFVKDREGRKLLANEADCKRIGLSEAQVIGKTDAEVYSPEEAARFEAVDRIVLEEGRPVLGTEDSYIDENGERHWILVSKLPLRDADGVVTGLVGVGHDITARKVEERRLQRAIEIQNALSGMATWLLTQTDTGGALDSLLLELGKLTGACRTFYFTMDDSTEIMDNTHEWCAEGIPSPKETLRDVPMDKFPWMTGCIRRGEVIHLKDLDAMPDEAASERTLLNAMGVKSIMIFPIFVRKQSAGFLGITAVREARDWETDEVLLLGLFAGILGNFMERQAAEESRLELERQMLQSQKMESLGVLAGGIAHDFNNILMAILGHADLARDELAPMAPARDSIEEIEKASRRAADLCRQMLAYSGKGRFIIERIDMGEMVEEMVHLLRTTISKKALLNLNLEKSLPPLQGDATQIRQVIMNLVINASEAIGERSGVITISTGAIDCTREYLTETYLDENLAPGLYVALEVSDTGCGMDRETQSRIFEPFFTTKFTGRGLGMAAVLGIVRGHKGALKVYSEPGRGSTFKLLFPVAEDAVDMGNHTAEKADGEWRGEGTVLLVDDEETIRALGKRMLERMGFEVLTAEDGREAVELYRTHREDIRIVLLDLTMPHMDGEETFRTLRGMDPGVRVVLSSGYTEHDVVARFAGKGLAGFMPKPYTLKGLKERLRAVLDPSINNEAPPTF